jgi:hypothetical protein
MAGFAKKLWIWFGIILIPAIIYSQGSGDAGMMISGDFDSRSRAADTPSRIYFLERAGLGQGNTISLASEFQLDWNIWGGINLWFALPYHFVTGDLATVHGVGDLRVVFSHTLAEAGDLTVKINVGGVVPSGYADEDKDGNPLPMAYQRSQGSASFLLSSLFYFRGWNLSAGYQRRVGPNNNAFTKDAWNGIEDVKDFSDSPGLWCGDDLVFRVRKDFDRSRASYSLSLLPAFRLSDDRIKVEGQYEPVEGSSGFSLNVSAGGEVRMGKYGYFHFLAAAPVLKRDVYSDGLERTVVITAGFGVQLPE